MALLSNTALRDRALSLARWLDPKVIAGIGVWVTPERQKIIVASAADHELIVEALRAYAGPSS